jgi:hypothetical protein
VAQVKGTRVPEEMMDAAGRRFRLASPATATALGVLVLVLIGVTVTLARLIHQLTIFNVATGLTIRWFTPPWVSLSRATSRVTRWAGS